MALALLSGLRPAPPWHRRADWPERLAEFLAARSARPFAWGRQDCVTVAADAALLMTGRDPIAGWRGSYADEDGAEAVVQPHGLRGFLMLLMAKFGAPECPVHLAQRGDWAMVSVGNHLVTGIVAGVHVLAPGMRGLVAVPLRRAVIAWAI
jgi:hypothetical protein